MLKPFNPRITEWELETNRDSEDQTKGDLSPIVCKNMKTMAIQSNDNQKINSIKNLNSTFICDFENCNKLYSQKYRMEIHKRTHVKLKI
jgi:hypothetical protein